MVEKLLNRTAIGDLIGVSKQRVHQMEQAQELPPPDAFDGDRPLWMVGTITRWAKQAGRQLRETQ